jgi:lipid A ethanolaminephosphotransferase
MRKLTISYEAAIAGCAIYVVAILNLTFWKRLYAIVAPDELFDWLFLGVVALGLACLTYLLFGAFAFRRVFKPVASILLVTSAAAAYFIGEFGILIDPNIVGAALETQLYEALEYLTPKFVLAVAVFGGLPAGLIWFANFPAKPFWPELRRRAALSLAMLAVTFAAALPFVQNLTSVFNEHRYLRHAVTPFNYVMALSAVGRARVAGATGQAAAFGEDARRRANGAGKTIAVIVVGETARAANFSLNGYGRPTNPKLAEIADLVSFTRAYSCGTTTAEVVPCMFSGLGRRDFAVRAAARRENLLDILQRAKFSVLWRDNQTGCKGVCARVPSETLTPPQRLLELHAAPDEILLAGLPDWIDKLDHDGVVVLHMIGSHGPAYFKRYPAEFERFTPACHDPQFSRCSEDAILNAYDNTLVYTDHVLAELVRMLRVAEQKGVVSMMLYASDHGESLGENNVYLHGLPYAIAPDGQKHIPFVFWASPNFRAAYGLDMACLAGKRGEDISHDNIFHTVLGVLGVETRVYRRELDITAACRRPTLSGLD